MLIEIISWTAVVVLVVTSVGLLISRDWRWSLGLLAVQYLGMFWLVRLHWPLAMAAVKLVTGWMAGSALNITRIGLAQDSNDDEEAWPQARLFRLLAAALVLLVVISATPRVNNVLPGIGLPAVFGGLILFGMGLLHLGITIRPLRVILGLLTVLSGFEIIYAALEGSVLVAALLAGINLGLALVGSYLLTAGPEPKTEESL